MNLIFGTSVKTHYLHKQNEGFEKNGVGEASIKMKYFVVAAVNKLTARLLKNSGLKFDPFIWHLSCS